MKCLSFITMFLLGSMLSWGQGDSIERLEQRLKEIDKQLGELSGYSLRGGAGAVGYRSDYHDSPHQTEWIQLSLSGEHLIDQIVIVPVLWRDSATGLQSDGFPEHFEIRAGRGGDSEGRVLARFEASESDLPRVAPLIIRCKPTQASWVKLIATKLSPRVWDGAFCLQLSEIMIFSGEENIALNQPVTTSSPEAMLGKAWSKHYLVDGFLPYLMDSSKGQQSKAYFSKVGIGDQGSLSFDLGKNLPVNRVHIHSPDLSDTVPQPYIDGFGIPEEFILEGSLHPDFSDASKLASYQMDSVYNTGPILMFRFPETTCRYLRFTATQPGRGSRRKIEGTLIGLAEMEIFSRGENVALGKAVTTSYDEANGLHSLSQITDGNNFYGEILPVRSWIQELAKRHELETEHPLIHARLQILYNDQKQKLRLLERIAVFLLAAILITFLVYRNLRQRAIFRTRNRIAADLHDNLGANLHAIGLLGDLAKNEIESLAEKEDLTELTEIVDEIRTVSQTTGDAANSCTNMLEDPELYSDLIGEMKHISKVILADFDHTFTSEGEEHVRGISKNVRVDLYLFYKECLTNILKHSEATEVSTRLVGDNKTIHLLVTDNGRGMGPAAIENPPQSLIRRTRLIGGKLEVSSPPAGGTSISLTYLRRRIKFRK